MQENTEAVLSFVTAVLSTSSFNVLPSFSTIRLNVTDVLVRFFSLRK